MRSTRCCFAAANFLAALSTTASFTLPLINEDTGNQRRTAAARATQNPYFSVSDCVSSLAGTRRSTESATTTVFPL